MITTDEEMNVSYTLQTEPMPFALTAGGSAESKACRILAAQLVHNGESVPLVDATLTYIEGLARLIETGDAPAPKIRAVK